MFVLHLGADGVRIMLERLANRAGITEVKVSAHKFRHAYATEVLRLGVDERSRQTFLGYSTNSMTKHYTEQFNNPDALKLHQVSPVEDMKL